MPAYIFEEWRAYDALFPFGDDREDWRMGMVASQIVNMASSKNSLSPQDFVLKPPKTQRQKDEDIRSALKGASK